MTQLSLVRHPTCGADALEFRLDAPAGSYNPFDTREIALRATVTAPSGHQTPLLGFAFQAHEPLPRQPGDPGPDPWRPTGPVEFRLRFLPHELGRHRLEARFAGAAEKSAERSFEVTRLPALPAVRLAPHGYAFQLESGEPWYPIGSNLCWADPTPEEPAQLPLLFAMCERLAAAGGNAIRLWCNAQWAQVIDWTPNEDPQPLSFGRLSLSGAAKLDAILARAEALGLRVMFCIDAANNWSRDCRRSPYWHTNGGPCHRQRDYFEHPVARAMTREKMRYVAARWAHSPAIWCWEFWNEVDGIGIPHVDEHQQLAWHQEMARTLRAADPERRLITTSTGHPLNLGALWRLPEIQFTQTHHYGYQDSVEHTALVLKGYHESNLAQFGKAHMATEIGTSFRFGQNPWETDGRTLHTSLWGSSILPRACGAALFWWWQQHIHDHDLYWAYTGLARFLAAERWHETLSEPVALRLLGATVDVWPPGPLKVPTTLSGSSFYRAEFSLDPGGLVPDSHLIPNTWYGSDLPHLALRRTFHVDFAVDGSFTLMVWGGAAVCNDIAAAGSQLGEPVVQVLLDGAEVLRRPVRLARTEGDDYCDRITIEVPAGIHEIQARNVGTGQFLTGHLVLAPYQTSRRRLHAQGVRCGDRTCLWFWNLDWAWPAFRRGEAPPAVAEAQVELADLRPGRYEVEWWDTHTGEVTSRSELDVQGPVTLDLPPVATSLAAKLLRRKDS